MSPAGPALLPHSFDHFGAMLRYLRRRARLSQRELAIAVGYSESHISRLEHTFRPPNWRGRSKRSAIASAHKQADEQRVQQPETDHTKRLSRPYS
jgi:transcriptional regulator with XRE-family HTH domain